MDKVMVSGQIATAKEQATGALEMFGEIHSKLEQANSILAKAAEEVTQQIKDLQYQLEQTNDQLKMNRAVQARLEKFGFLA